MGTATAHGIGTVGTPTYALCATLLTPPAAGRSSAAGTNGAEGSACGGSAGNENTRGFPAGAVFSRFSARLTQSFWKNRALVEEWRGETGRGGEEGELGIAHGVLFRL